MENEIKYKAQKALKLVEHIETHIKNSEGGTNPDDLVMCKICGKSIDEIWADQPND